MQTGKVVVRILKGEARRHRLGNQLKLELYVNPGAAAKQGVTLSDALIKSAAVVVK